MITPLFLLNPLTWTSPVLESPPPGLTEQLANVVHTVLKNQCHFHVFEYFHRFSQYIITI